MTIRQCALVGFNAFETKTLESFFRLAGRRPPGYAIADSPATADVLLVNGDDALAVQRVWADHRDALGIVIGGSAAGTSWVAMARPIRLLLVLEMIEKLMASKASVPAKPSAVAQAPAPLAPVADMRALVQPFAPPPEPAPAPAHPPAVTPAKAPTTIFGNSTGFDSFKASANHEDAKDDDDLILVVDDSDIVLRFMQGRLQRFGYSVALANSGEQAVQMAKARPYKFVFLDVMMPGIDGYQTCRMIKAAKSDAPAPVVVMLSSRGGSIDKIRGTLAGADAYLTKPLAEAALIKVLADFDRQAATNFQATRPVTGIR